MVQRLARRIVAAAGLLLAAGATAQPNRDEAEATRDRLFAWCANAGVGHPPRTEAEMQAASPVCAERSARIAADKPPPRSAEWDREAAPPGPADLCAQATAEADRPTPAGRCLTYPQAARIAAPGLVDAFRAAIPDGEWIEEQVRRALILALRGSSAIAPRARLQAIGFVCWGPTCRLDLGFVEWRRRDGRINTHALCSFAFVVRPAGAAVSDEDVSVVQLCL
jgi:hypothetical protein